MRWTTVVACLLLTAAAVEGIRSPAPLVATDNAAYQITVTPPRPGPEDRVVLTVRSQCPATFEAPAIDGRVIRLTEVPNLILAPCFSLPMYDLDIAIGRLAPGEYTVLLLFADGVEPPVLNLVFHFQVVPETAALRLGAGRFRLTAFWTRPDGTTAVAEAVPLGADTGAFRFSGDAGLKLLARVLDGCAVNGHRWVLLGGLTEAAVEILVEDTSTSTRRTYRDPAGRPFRPVRDATAFACP